MKCPICGNPVPPSNGVKPRKYCSTKCANRASHEFSVRRGYKRKKKFRKVCAVCGKVFFSNREDAKCCSHSCGNSFSATARGRKSRLSAKARLAVEKKRLALERCRETAPITVEVRGNVRTEWRGQRVIGCRAVGNIHHS